MTNLKRPLMDNELVKLSRTTCNQAMKVIAGNVIDLNGGLACRDHIVDVVIERLVEPFGDLLGTPYTDNRINEIWTSMACTRPHYWLTSDGNGVWRFTETGKDRMEQYFYGGQTNFGFSSDKDLLDLLDLATEPHDPKKRVVTLAETIKTGGLTRTEPKTPADQNVDDLLNMLDNPEPDPEEKFNQLIDEAKQMLDDFAKKAGEILARM